MGGLVFSAEQAVHWCKQLPPKQIGDLGVSRGKGRSPRMKRFQYS